MSGTEARTPVFARKSSVIMITLLIAAATFGVTTQTWVTVVPSGSDVQIPPIHVSGSQAATSVTALAVVGVAGALAVSIASRWVRWLIAALVLLAGVGIVVASAVVVADPLSAAQGAVAKATGMSNGPGEVTASALPTVAVVLGCLLVLCAVWIAVVGRSWTQRSRYERAGAAGNSSSDDSEPLDAIDSWDQLSRGQDPS